MPDFFRVDPASSNTFIRGAARLMWCGTTIAFPVKISDVIDTSVYNAQANWFELGATKGGVQISVNAQEEDFDVDQVTGSIDSRPTSWDVAVQTQLAEMTPARMAMAWEGSGTTQNVTTTGQPDEIEIGVGTPVVYTQRRLAVLFQRSDLKLRGFFFRKVQRAASESAVTFNKTGEQIAIPIRWRCLPDLSITDIYKRYFIMRDQV